MEQKENLCDEVVTVRIQNYNNNRIRIVGIRISW